MVQFENANTAMVAISSLLYLSGTVNFFNNSMSAIRALDTHSAILLAGTVVFTNNTADYGGAVLMMNGNMTVADTAHIVFQGNHAKNDGGGIASLQHVTIAGSALVQFINNSAYKGGAILSYGNVTIANEA